MTRGRTHAKSVVAVLALVLLAVPAALAERVSLTGQGDASIDLPEGYIVAGSSANGFQLEYAIVPVSMLVRVYGTGTYQSPAEALEKSLGSLGATFEQDAVEWRNQTGSIATFSLKLNDVPMTGYAMAATIPNGGGTVVCLAWSPENQQENTASFLISIIDSVNIDAGSYFEAGIMTQYLFPDTDDWEDLTLTIDGKAIETRMRSSSSEAAAYLIEREYEVLYNYIQSKQWLQAWQRYYRMIFRDSYHRLLKPAFDIYNALAPAAADDTDLAQKLLTWTQGFPYEREKTTSDFADLPGILQGNGSDCDSRSMLLAVLLTQMNQDAILLVSAQYGHALAAFISDHPGHSFTFGGKEYLMGDTTATGVSWGMIAAEQDDQSKWIDVAFP